jgi:hypothetical protein
MTHNKLSLLLVAAIVGLFAMSAFGQTDVFSDPNADYTFGIPDAAWKMTTKPSATSPNVEYVYGDRSDGAFEVRRVTVAKNRILTDMIHEDEEAKLQFRPGFVAGREENFAGRLRGSVYNFEYVAAGKAMAGRFYFLRANDTTVYLLKFTGPKDILRSIRTQMDSIARTFAVK